MYASAQMFLFDSCAQEQPHKTDCVTHINAVLQCDVLVTYTHVKDVYGSPQCN